MHLKPITDKKTWNNFITLDNFPFYSFLWSWEWLDFKEDFWFPTLRFWVYDKNDNLVWLFPLIKTKAKRWTYLFAPHSPLIAVKSNALQVNSEKWIVKNNFEWWRNDRERWNSHAKLVSASKKSNHEINSEWQIINSSGFSSASYFDVLEKITPQLKEIAQQEWASFIRLNPPVEATYQNYQNFKKLWFRNAPIHEHAEDTHLLDLTPSEEELFQNLKKKDRYLINRAIKEWVQIRIDNKPDHIETLIKMHQQHSKKVWYVPFSEKYIKNLYKHFWDNIRTISTSYNWHVESILITIKFNETTSYYIAASEITQKKFSPNYLAQRTAIKQAKQDWAKLYNFWWVSPDNNPKHPLHGVSDFKRKWGWYDFFLVHAQDLVVSPKYWVTWGIETLRRIKRGYYYVYPQNSI